MAQRISIGFHASPPLALRVEDKALTALQKALAAGETWHELESEDGQVTVKLEHVLWLRVEASDQRVGFGA
ncbi:MAG: hypothetical protein V9E83_09550 [Baekduia sp.]